MTHIYYIRKSGNAFVEQACRMSLRECVELRKRSTSRMFRVFGDLQRQQMKTEAI